MIRLLFTYLVAALGAGVLFVAAVMLIGATLEGWSAYNEQRDACLKGASNGLEIERCKR